MEPIKNKMEITEILKQMKKADAPRIKEIKEGSKKRESNLTQKQQYLGQLMRCRR